MRRRVFLLLMAIIVAIVFLASGFFIFTNRIKSESDAAPIKDAITEAATAGTIPTLETIGNPLAGMPEVNPVEKTNPFTDLYNNPFGD